MAAPIEINEANFCAAFPSATVETVATTPVEEEPLTAWVVVRKAGDALPVPDPWPDPFSSFPLPFSAPWLGVLSGAVLVHSSQGMVIKVVPTDVTTSVPGAGAVGSLPQSSQVVLSTVVLVKILLV